MVASIGLLTASTYNSRPTSSIIMDPAVKFNFYKKYYVETCYLEEKNSRENLVNNLFQRCGREYSKLFEQLSDKN